MHSVDGDTDLLHSVDLEWPRKAGHEGQSFQADLLNNARIV